MLSGMFSARPNKLLFMVTENYSLFFNINDKSLNHNSYKHEYKYSIEFDLKLTRQPCLRIPVRLPFVMLALKYWFKQLHHLHSTFIFESSNNKLGQIGTLRLLS